MLQRHSFSHRRWHGGRGTSVAFKQHRTLCVPQAASSAGETDEPGISKQDLGIVYSQQLGDVSEDVEFPMKVPLLPFPVEEVMLPGSVKTLHLFEARYLSLLDEVLSNPQNNKFFGHVVVEQPGDPVGSKASAFPGAYVGDTFVFLMGTLVRVLEVKSLQIGALVRIQAEARISITQIHQVDPYIRATVVTLPDEPLQQADWQLVHDQVQQLTATMQDLQNLAQKFRTKQTAALQQAMYWWERQPLMSSSSSSSTRSTSTGGEDANSSSSAQARAASSSTAIGSGSGSSTEKQDTISSSSSSGGYSAELRDASSSNTGSGSTGDQDLVCTSSDGGSAEDGNASSSGSGGSHAAAATASDTGMSELADLAERAARLSFAALQCTPEASPMVRLVR
eukprot:GHUV01019838.1.p1 GENE.GHUV01019838.1~~GHUV01019838.1.p1  ORF type:complete len:394 (+),score=135.34 GHUV01019838.1:375-1556(+)